MPGAAVRKGTGEAGRTLSLRSLSLSKGRKVEGPEEKDPELVEGSGAGVKGEGRG